MSARPPSSADGTAVVVEITPRNYRQRAIASLATGVLLILAAVLLDVAERRSFNPFLPVLALGYGVYCARQARRQVTSKILQIDRSGFRTGDGLHDRGWDGVVMVWVGSSTGLRRGALGQPVMAVFTAAGVEFAQRAGTSPKPLVLFPLSGSLAVPDLCRRLRTLTDALVVDGSKVSRRKAAAALQRAAAG